MLLRHRFEALAVGVVGVGYYHKCLRVIILDCTLHLDQLLARNYEEYHLLLGVGVHSARLDVGTTAVQLFENVTAEILLWCDVIMKIIRSYDAPSSINARMRDDTYIAMSE